MHYSFTECWLLFAGIPEHQVKVKSQTALERVCRYPWPYSHIYFINIWMLNWFGPLLVLGKISRANKLASADFGTLTKRIKENRLVLLRIAAIFAFAPLIEVLIDEKPNPNPPEHPLKSQTDALKTKPGGSYDYIIIGSGAGGAPAAYALSKQGFSVAVIEKGDILKLDTAPRMLEKYYVNQGLTLSLTGGVLLVLAGSSVGGTTSINSGTCLRPPMRRLEAWDKNHDTNFGTGELEPYFKLVEEQICVCTPPRNVLSKSAELFENGLDKLGRVGAYVLPRNSNKCAGLGRCCFGCPGGLKQSTDYAYLPSAINNGTELFHNTTAVGIKEKRNIVELDLENALGKFTVSCRQLIIAGGALYTPGILKRNKLGTAYNRAGRNLKIHPASKVFASFPDHYHGELGVPQGLGYQPSELPRVTMEGIHTPKSMIGQILSVSGTDFNWWMERSDHLSSFGLMIRDRAVGSLIEANPVPWINYKLDHTDAEDMGAGIKFIAKVFFAAGAERVLLPLSGNSQKQFDNMQQINAIPIALFHPKSMILSGFHPQGTAGMGRVVDNDLKLMGSRRISVCDASVLPDSPGVNPQVTIMALSLRLAKHLSDVKLSRN